jgi:excisionase family DNA binding protein
VPDLGHDHDRVRLEDLDGFDFASVAEYASITRADPRTIRRGIADGLIPATRVGSEYRIPTRWIRKQARAGVAA